MFSNIPVALAGNPNAGKTTIFNNLTGANQRVGNYPGVTVEKRVGKARFKETTFNIVDLPGTYSLAATAEDELVARNYLLQDNPAVIINVIDASNLYRNLFLTLELLELEKPMLLVLNMIDAAQIQGTKIDITNLATTLSGLKIVTAIGSKQVGTQEILETLTTELKSSNFKIDYGCQLEKSISNIIQLLEPLVIPANIPPRWLALKLLENDAALFTLQNLPLIPENIMCEIQKLRTTLTGELAEDISLYITGKKYEFINYILQAAIETTHCHKPTLSDKIDKILTHKYIGLPIFLFFMWLLFNMVFTLGAYPQGLIEDAISLFSNQVRILIPAGELNDLIVDGIIGGVGGVIVFLPNILLLFFGIAILEGTGYMARAAFLMDRVMCLVGLHGKSFIPLLLGFGCTVPAIMGTRTLENKHDRFVTMLVSPFMSCSARLPVYTLLIGAFFSDNIAGSILFLIYIAGVLIAILLAKLFRKTLFPGKTEAFLMEMPPYRMPTYKSILLQMWERAVLYIKKAGTIILASSILIWFLTNNPTELNFSQNYDQNIQNLTLQIEQISDNSHRELLSQEINKLEQQQHAETIAQSYAGQIGKFVEPVIAPLGFNWKIGVALLSAFSAKEVLVSTLGTIYSVGNIENDSQTLALALQADPTLSPLVSLSLIFFVLLYTPCMATLAIIYRETASWKWPLFTATYSLLLAWLVSFLIFQLGSHLGF
ncbi:ferrous iron transport protein B [Succinispira mobilis]|uniref:ferrous iron transport protein B n=1 Tax=Succinispira mobilis TaxID=78120 RepID=UPI000376312F|nr:ferrous iron transport protein B [Succinispira mobilis]